MSYDPQSPTFAAARTKADHTAIHITLTLIGLTFAVFLIAQVRSVAGQSSILRWQITTAETQTKNLVDAEKQLRDLAVQRESLVKQSAEIQAKYQSLLNDVLDLAKDDKDAKEVVEAWKIQRSTPTPPK